MMNRFKNTGFAAVCLLLANGCMTVPAELTASELGPPLWSISDADSTVYLFGTFHALPADTKWKSDTFLTAMAASSVTVTEVDAVSADAQAALQQLVGAYGLNPPGVTLSSVLGEDRAARLFETAAEFGIPPQALEPLRPWLAILSLTQAANASFGFDTASGVEAGVLAIASEEGDRVEHLESVERQIKALASLDDQEMLANFDASLAEIENLETQLSAGLDAWLAGDTNGLYNVLLADSRAVSPGAFDVIFVQRNREWVDSILALLAREENVFVAVGAGHLVGDDSVIDMLSEEGLATRRLQ